MKMGDNSALLAATWRIADTHGANMKIYIDVGVNLNEIAQQLYEQLSPADIADFVKKLDRKMNDWGFIIEMFQHFEKQYNRNKKYYDE